MGAGIRGRRSLHAVLVVLLVGAAIGAFVYSSSAEKAAMRDAAKRARLAAQIKLASVVGERDLEEPADGGRYTTLHDAIAHVMPAEIDAVTLWSPTGRILYHDDQARIGTRPTYPREFLGDVARGSTETKVEAGLLKTFVPVWVEPGGTIAVAQLDQQLGPIRASATLWRTAAGVLGALSLLVFVRLVVGAVKGKGQRIRPQGTLDGTGVRVGPRPMERPAPPATPMAPVAGPPTGPSPAPAASGGVEVVKPRASSAKPAPEDRAAPSQAPSLRGPHAFASHEPTRDDAAARRLERERDEAVARAEAAERALDGVRTQQRAALEQVAALEARLIAAADGPLHSQEDVQALRDQIRDTAERLYRTEEENRALRIRVSELENPLAPPGELVAQLNEIAHDRLASGG
jgi:hypothetical protein